MKYVQYQPFNKIKNYQSRNVVTESMFSAQQIAFDKLKEYLNGEDSIKWLQKKLHVKTQKELLSLILPEQMDSVCCAIYNIENNQEFIIGDETGIGKGRILASIARYALSNKKKVLFVTEAEHLFTDFYRDLLNTQTTQYIKDQIYILHNNASIYDLNNKKIYSSLSKANNDKILETGKFEYIKNKQKVTFKSNIIFTTYSQFNRIETAKKKIKFLSEFIDKDTIILFDEFHNSTGNSTTKEMKDEILKLGGHSIYSSATFLDNYEQINSFKNILNLTDKDNKAIELIKTKNSNKDEIKNQLAYMMTSNLNLLRREHKEISKINYVTVDEQNQNELNFALNKYRQIIDKMFDTYQVATSSDKNSKNKWLALGSTINRLAKILLLIKKRDFLIKRIKHYLSLNKKCVITLNSTFSSIIDLCIEYENKLNTLNVSINNEDTNTNNIDDEFDRTNKTNNKSSITYKNIDFKHLLLHLVDNLFLEVKETQDLVSKLNELKEEINDFPNIELSVIDSIKEYFEQKGIAVLEISGRTNELKKNEQQFYYQQNISKINKAEIINKFNNYINATDETIVSDKKYDVIILTTAGSTGISLHASNDFKDKRQRVLIEYEITNRVKKRIQFFGRVERRNQVSSPIIESIVSDSPFEKRIVAIEEMKLTSSRAFVGSDYEVSSIDIDYYNETMDYLARMYLIYNYNIAKKIGVSPFKATIDDFYFIDMILKRSIILTDEEQTKLFNYLDEGYTVYQKCINDYEEKISLAYTENVLIGKTSLIFSNMDKKENDKFLQFDKKNKITSSSLLPVVLLSECFNENTNYPVSEKQLKETLNTHLKQFNQNDYLNTINKIKISNFYEDAQELHKNKNKMKQLTIGTQIIFNLNNNNYYGYVENIKQNYEYEENKQYASHMYYVIRLISPENLKENNRIVADKIHISGNILLENSNFQIINKQIDFSKYIRENKKVEQKQLYLIGNPFYLNMFDMIIDGEIVTIKKKHNIQFNGLRLKNNSDYEKVKQFVVENQPILDKEKFIEKIKTRKNVYDKSNNINITFNNDKNSWIINININNEEIVNFNLRNLLLKYKTKDENIFEIPNFAFSNMIKISYSLFHNKGTLFFG